MREELDADHSVLGTFHLEVLAQSTMFYCIVVGQPSRDRRLAWAWAWYDEIL